MGGLDSRAHVYCALHTTQWLEVIDIPAFPGVSCVGCHWGYTFHQQLETRLVAPSLNSDVHLHCAPSLLPVWQDPFHMPLYFDRRGGRDRAFKNHLESIGFGVCFEDKWK